MTKAQSNWLWPLLGGMTSRIAWRNLSFDHVRFFVTLAGVVTSTTLMGIQIGLLLSFMQTSSAIVDNSKADLWITGRGARAVDIGIPINKSRRFLALEVEGVESAEPYVLMFAYWKRPDNARETVIVVGCDPNSETGLPWAPAPGTDAQQSLAIPYGVLIDELYASKLDVDAVGQRVEINDRHARVAGFTRGIRTFTQAPYVFTSLKNAQYFVRLRDAIVTHILVRVKEGYDREEVKEALSRRIPDAEVMTSREFSDKTRRYWIMTTGAGLALLGSSLLAFVVGALVVAQTLYAATVERLHEYAAIRAIGGSRRFLYSIVLKQALICWAIGYAVGMGLVLATVVSLRNSATTPVFDLHLSGMIAIVDLLMCSIASLLSLRKIMTLDPVEVFK